MVTNGNTFYGFKHSLYQYLVTSVQLVASLDLASNVFSSIGKVLEGPDMVVSK